MGKNSRRTPENQSWHDKIVADVVRQLEGNGYRVQADHIGHRNGQPPAFGGHIPDITATGSSAKFLVEVEDCSTYADEDTHAQLQAFSKAPGYICYLVIPNSCTRNGSTYDPVPEARRQVKTAWGLGTVRIGIYNWTSKTVAWDTE